MDVVTHCDVGGAVLHLQVWWVVSLGVWCHAWMDACEWVCRGGNQEWCCLDAAHSALIEAFSQVHDLSNKQQSQCKCGMMASQRDHDVKLISLIQNVQ